MRKKIGLHDMHPSEIREAVKTKYSSVALDPCAQFNFPVGKAFALQVGYPEEILNKLPTSLYESFTGANNPQPYTDLKEGEIILDLGCGAGLDLYFYSTSVGEKGKAYGLDISEAMIIKAQSNMKKTGCANVEFECGHSEDIPFPDNYFDVVASNGIYNLSPDKKNVMDEVYRVLKPGGRTVFSEIVLKEKLPDEEVNKINDWFRCIGGALPEKDFLFLLEESGFNTIEVISKIKNARTGHKFAVCANIRAYKSGSSQ